MATTTATTSSTNKKRKAADEEAAATQISLEAALGFIRDASRTQADFKVLREAIDAADLAQNVALLPRSMAYLRGALRVADHGKAKGDNAFPDVYPDWVHAFVLTWTAAAGGGGGGGGEQETLDIRCAKQKGRMHAGTTMFEIDCLQIGPLKVVVNSGGGDLPEYIDGVSELCRLLKPRGVDSQKKVQDFVNWVCAAVVPKLVGRRAGQAAKDELFSDYTYGDDESGER